MYVYFVSENMLHFFFIIWRNQIFTCVVCFKNVHVYTSRHKCKYNFSEDTCKWDKAIFSKIQIYWIICLGAPGNER